MTFAQLWLSIRTAWHSRPFAIMLPIVAFAWFWWSHGHVISLATHDHGGSLPTWQEFIAGAALLTTKFERISAFFIGAPTSSPPLPAPSGKDPV